MSAILCPAAFPSTLPVPTLTAHKMGLFMFRNIRRWSPFRSKDLHSLMLPCSLLCHLLGLFPYKVTGSGYERSRPAFALTWIFAFLYVIYFLVLFYHFDVTKEQAYDSLPANLQGNAFILLASSSTLSSYLLSWKRMDLLQRLHGVSSSLPAKYFEKIAPFVHLKDIVGVTFLFLHCFNVYAKDDVMLTLNKMFGLYTTSVVLAMDMQYMDCVHVLRVCFERIHDEMLKLRPEEPSEGPQFLKKVYLQCKSVVLLARLRDLKKYHHDVCEVMQKLNCVFSFHVLVSLTLAFVEITFSLYFYILQQFGQDNQGVLTKQIWYSYFITSVTYYTVKLVLMVWACEVAKRQANRIGIVLFQLLHDTVDDPMRMELKTMSLQLFHRDNKFSAKGLCVDAQLLTSFTGGITTNLLILIQFRLASTCDA